MIKMNCRVLKRVPLDFYYTQALVWCGYGSDYLAYCPNRRKKECSNCRRMAAEKMIPLAAKGEFSGCPLFHEFYKIPDHLKCRIEPPAGDGYQLWEYTSEGSPYSPVFTTYEDLCAWCERNATIYAYLRVTKEQWAEFLKQEIFTVCTSPEVRIPLPMEEKYLLDGRYDIYTSTSDVTLLHAGALTNKFPQRVNIEEMNRLAYTIQHFNKVEYDGFVETVRLRKQMCPAEALKIALDICPAAARCGSRNT